LTNQIVWVLLLENHLGVLGGFEFLLRKIFVLVQIFLGARFGVVEVVGVQSMGAR